MTSGFLSNPFFGGLAFRILLFLSLAMLPIGMIAVIQTHKIADQSQNSAELSLMAVTEQAVSIERTAFQEALGAGQALASIVNLVRDDPERCSKFLNTYKQSTGAYRLVGFVGMDGLMACSSAYEMLDFSGLPTFSEAVEKGTRTVIAGPDGTAAEEKTVLANVPVFDEGAMVGLVSISIALKALEDSRHEQLAVAPVSMITFNANGDILTTMRTAEITQGELPGGYGLKQLTGHERQVFTAANGLDEQRVYAVIPLISGTVYAMSVWPVDTPLLETDFSGRLSSLLPVVMWLASLIVAFWALNRLAIRHIRKLGRQMRHFAINRALPRKPLGDRLPHEIVAMEQSFLGMADSILQDEAKLEDSLREKNILLKEVHHRVKNNLQLISSIMNMQIRQAPTDANRVVLQRLQDRILSLATVHKNLYHDNEMTRVNAGVLLKEIVSRNLAVGLAAGSGITVTEDYDTIHIGPDDAAPLTLLVSEAVTNALKYTPQERSGGSVIEVSLKYTGEERATLVVRNTSGGEASEDGTGLGSRLIQAFARQLNGDLRIMDEGGFFSLELSFPVPLASKLIYDY